jgi:cell wall-associated NlpC family hydrolase
MADWTQLRILSGVLTLALVLGGCSTAPSRLRGPDEMTTGTASLVSQQQAEDVTIAAVGLVGTPYRYGGNTPQSGFDCSGLVDYVYETAAGIELPRTVSRLQYWGQPVSRDDLRSGDLILFGRPGDATHVGIYVGNASFVHAPSTGGTVRLDSLASKYWAAQRVAFRRP